jgi:hypothetical protein
LTQAVPVAFTESRWAATLTSALVFALILLLPGRYQATPGWFPWAAFFIMTASMVAVNVAPTLVLVHRIERVVVLSLVAIVWLLEVRIIVRLIGDMIAGKHGYSSITLLESAAMIWTINILLFALLYWQVDRARLEVHPSVTGTGPDFQFAESEDAEPGDRWFPSFVDYLFLAFVTSTSFAPPDYMRPKSHRAKVAVMCQASISLTTLVVVASRAVATLS